MNISLNSEEVFNIAKVKGKTLVFNQLSNINSIEQLFSDTNNILLIYLTKDNYGHWCCLTKNNNTVNFFDSYGMYPDYQIKKIPKQFRIKSNQDFPHLLYLLSKFNGEVQYNEKQYQEYNENINTCGRWCGLFMRCGLNINNFQQLMKKTKMTDRKITRLTS